MLVLTRRIGQEIVIDGNIRVFVVSIHGKRVRLGIRAPRAVHVIRQETEGDAGREAQAAAEPQAPPEPRPALARR